MLPALLIGFAMLLTLFQLWSAAAYIYAYRQVREGAMLVQAAMSLAYVLFFVVALTALFSGQELSRASALLLLLLVVIATVAWRVLNGPALLARHYPRRLLDVLAFRRPPPDLKRKVRGK